MRPTPIFVACLGLAIVSGCAERDTQHGHVRGLVSIDGVPLAQGSILWIPVDGNLGTTTGGTIADGHYELRGDEGPAVGWNRIEIRSPRKSGRMIPKPLAPPGEMVEADEEGVAKRFNTSSRLRVHVPQGKSTHDFEVESRP